MATIRIEFYQSHRDVPAFDTPEEAKNSEFVSPYAVYGKEYTARIPDGMREGYAVLFELKGKYAVYVHNEDRYYSSYLPFDANCLAGGWWYKGQPVNWEKIGNLSQDEKDLLKDFGLDDDLIDKLGGQS